VSLNDAHATLHESTGHETLLAERRRLGIIQAVKFLDESRFLADIQSFRSGHLHAIGELEGFNACRQFRLARILLELTAIEPCQQIELGALLLGGHLRAALQILDWRTLRFQGSPLIDTRQETRPP